MAIGWIKSSWYVFKWSADYSLEPQNLRNWSVFEWSVVFKYEKRVAGSIPLQEDLGIVLCVIQMPNI